MVLRGSTGSAAPDPERPGTADPADRKHPAVDRSNQARCCI